MVFEYQWLSIASLEALFYRLWLLVYDAYGFVDGYNGILLKDLDELDKKILEFYNSPELRKSYSENSIKLAKQKFSMEKSVNEFISLYKK